MLGHIEKVVSASQEENLSPGTDFADILILYFSASELWGIIVCYLSHSVDDGILL